MLCRAFVPHVPATRALAIPTLRLVHTAALRHFSARSAPASPRHPSSQQSSLAREVLRTRTFTSTTSRRAEEDPKMNMVFEQQQKVLKLLQERPEVLDYMKEFVGLLKDNGVDVTSGQLPSKMEMFRLLMKTEVRDSAMKMAGAFQEAGIDLQSKDMMQSLMALQKQFKE